MEKEESFSLLSYCQSDFGGYLACSVCACYISLIPSCQFGVHACDLSIKLACKKWRKTFSNQRSLKNATNDTLLSPSQVLDNIPILEKHLRISKEYCGIISENRRWNPTNMESTMCLMDLHGLLYKLEMKCYRSKLEYINAAFCQSGVCFLIRVVLGESERNQTEYIVVDSHSSEFARHIYPKIPAETKMPGFIYRTTSQDLMVEFLVSKSGGGLSDQLLNQLDNNFSHGTGTANWHSDPALSYYQFTCYVLILKDQ